jgi:CMP-N,N'-diacetyllegionaminic acid synthase
MITAIIPARSGSKRLPGKNIKELAGKPLIFYTIDSVLDHHDISRIILTTDSKNYIDLAKEEYGDKIDYEYRPPEYARDDAKVYDEIKRLVSKNIIQTDWYIVCLPTCPLRNHKVVGNLLDKWRDTNSPLFSASENNFPAQFAFTIAKNSDEWAPLTGGSPMLSGNTRSQDIPKTYRPNGAMYLQHVKNIHECTFYINAGAYLMTREESIDIDTELDFITCENMLTKKRNIS